MAFMVALEGFTREAKLKLALRRDELAIVPIGGPDLEVLVQAEEVSDRLKALVDRTIMGVGRSATSSEIGATDD